jgi:ClpP class serine protease
MPNWSAVLEEINRVKSSIASASALDIVRRQYLAELSKHTERNTIAYYSAWLQRGPNTPNLSINDTDKNAFMATVHGMDRKLGLDLILHTPGGSIAAAESLVDYLRRMFGTNIGRSSRRLPCLLERCFHVPAGKLFLVSSRTWGRLIRN